jgi:hypothetical protein
MDEQRKNAISVSIEHQLRQIQRRAARQHAQKMARIRRDLDELQRTKPLRTETDEPDALAGYTR